MYISNVRREELKKQALEETERAIEEGRQIAHDPHVPSYDNLKDLFRELNN